MRNKWLNGVLPAILIHICIGSVYAWTLFVEPLATYLNTSSTKVQIAFSLAIFFLGMSAAFGGKIVERNVRFSGLLSALFVFSGLTVASLGVLFKTLILIYLGYGVIMGIGLGLGYLTPVKTLMVWFPNNKGFATGIAVCAFGFASSVASPMITFLLNHTSLVLTFVIMASIYIGPMLAAAFLVKKPSDWHEEIIQKEGPAFKKIDMLKNRTFRFIWLLFFLNIASGLSLISTASMSMKEANIGVGTVTLVVSIMGIFNGLGRIILATISDKFKNRAVMYRIITMVSFCFCVMCYALTSFKIPIIITLCIISACYGAGFSCLPSLLADLFGMTHASKIHGLALSAWGFAGLVGNNLGTFLYNFSNTFKYLFIILAIVYFVELLISMYLYNTLKNND